MLCLNLQLPRTSKSGTVFNSKTTDRRCSTIGWRINDGNWTAMSYKPRLQPMRSLRLSWTIHFLYCFLDMRAFLHPSCRPNPKISAMGNWRSGDDQFRHEQWQDLDLFMSDCEISERCTTEGEIYRGEADEMEGGRWDGGRQMRWREAARFSAIEQLLISYLLSEH